MKHAFFIVFICFLCIQQSTAQQDRLIGQMVELRAHDGNLYVGKVLSLTDTEITIESKSLGEITLQRVGIKKVIYKNQEGTEDNNGFLMDDYNSTHYFVNQSGFSLKKGQSYYENVGVFFNSYTVGITDNFSLTAGVEIATLLFGQSPPSFFISPKFTIPFGERAGGLSFGSTVLVSFVDNNIFSVGVAQASATFGTRNNNFTIGSGIGFSFNDGVSEGVLPFNISGMWRLSNKLSFVTDNFIIIFDDLSDATAVLAGGIRIHFGGNGSALNVGLFRPTEDFGDLLALPFVSLTIPIK